jgi:hypothetical protein
MPLCARSYMLKLVRVELWERSCARRCEQVAFDVVGPSGRVRLLFLFAEWSVGARGENELFYVN